jgi:serine/threonine-protein kinase
VIQGHRLNEPERPSQRLGQLLPADFEAVIMRCLAKAPEDRFASAADLRAALEACALPAWTAEESKRFWEHERNELVRRWTDKTIV